MRWLPETFAEAATRGQVPEWMPGSLPATAPRRLFVDVSELALEDLGAGVQRVTRRVLAAMLAASPSGLGVEPVRLSSDQGFVLAREFLAGALGLPAGCLGQDCPFEAGPGDAFLALDFHREHADAIGDAVATLRARGVATCFVAHDALPATHPEWFPPGVADEYARWLAMLSRSADAVLCISGATRDAVLAQLAASETPLSQALNAAAAQGMDLPAVGYDEASFRLALNEDAMATEKLAEGIRAFCADAVKLEVLMQKG